jgi:hypothetical protein
MLFFELLIGLFQTGYDILLLHIGRLHFGVISRYALKSNLETFQIIVSFPIELVEFDIFLL